MSSCSEEEMRLVIDRMNVDAAAGLATTEELLSQYPEDARLHFLRGSILVGAARPIEGHAALSRAVALVPDYAIARFQLGLFELSSGEAERALATLKPLETSSAAPDHLRDFAQGLGHLAADRFGETIASLKRGIAANAENQPLNHDMQLIIDRCLELTGGDAGDMPAQETSATSLLLGQIGGTRH